VSTSGHARGCHSLYSPHWRHQKLSPHPFPPQLQLAFLNPSPSLNPTWVGYTAVAKVVTTFVMYGFELARDAQYSAPNPVMARTHLKQVGMSNVVDLKQLTKPAACRGDGGQGFKVNTMATAWVCRVKQHKALRVALQMKTSARYGGSGGDADLIPIDR